MFAPRALGTLHPRPPDAEGCRLVEQNRLELVGVGRPRDDRQQRSGPVFFHLNGRGKDVERAGFEQASLRVADDFGGDVVEIGFQERHRVAVGRGFSRTDEESQQVGALWKILGPRAVADRLDGHLGQRPKAVDERFQNGRASRRRQFGIDRHVDERHAFEQFGGARRGHGADAMGDRHLPASGRNAAGDDLIGAQHVKADGCSDDIDDRIDGPDFVKVNFVHSHAVHASLGGGHGAKDPQGQIALGRRQTACLVDQGLNVGQVTMRVLLGMFDPHVRRSKAALDHCLRDEFDPL